MDKPLKILFLTDNFPPEFNAPATRTFEHCREWVKHSTEVTVITCVPNFPQGQVYQGYKNKFYQKEIIEGINVIRVWSYITSNSGIFKRILDHISFAITAFGVGLFVKADIIIATSPQFFSALSGFALGKIKRKPWIMEVRDLWPESIRTLNILKEYPRALTMLEKLELFLYKSSQKVIVVTDSFKTNLIQRGISKDKIFIIKNGVDLSLYKPKSKSSDLLEKYPILNRKFIVGYMGTHGIAHKLDFILNCANRLKTDHELHFLFIGDGSEKESLNSQKEKLSLSNVTMLTSVSKNEVPEYLSLFDVALVPLRKADLFKTVIPSKIFECAAMRIPILLGVDGEAKELIQKYSAGVFFEPENEKNLIEVILRLKSDTELYFNLKIGGHLLASNFDRKYLAQKLLKIIWPISHRLPSSLELTSQSA